MDIADLIIETAALPFVVALATALLAFALNRRYAALGLVLGFLAAYWLIMGLPPLAPRGSAQKLPYLALLAAGAGLAVEIGAARFRLLRPGLALALPLVIGIWLGWRGLARGEGTSFAAVAALVVAGGAVLLAYGQPPEAGRRGLEAPAVALVLALALGALALLGRTASTAQLAFALAAALGGGLILNWPSPALSFRRPRRLCRLRHPAGAGWPDASLFRGQSAGARHRDPGGRLAARRPAPQAAGGPERRRAGTAGHGSGGPGTGGARHWHRACLGLEGAKLLNRPFAQAKRSKS